MSQIQVTETQQLESAVVVEETSVQSVYKELETFISSSTLVYGSRSATLETEQSLEKYETLLNSSAATNEDEEKIVSHSDLLIQTKKTEIEIVKESSRKIQEIHTELVAAIETADQKRSVLKAEKCETNEEIENISKEYDVSSFNLDHNRALHWAWSK